MTRMWWKLHKHAKLSSTRKTMSKVWQTRSFCQSLSLFETREQNPTGVCVYPLKLNGWAQKVRKQCFQEQLWPYNRGTQQMYESVSEKQKHWLIRVLKEHLLVVCPHMGCFFKYTGNVKSPCENTVLLFLLKSSSIMS